MANAQWEAEYDAHRFDDEARPERIEEDYSVTHARTDGSTLPCGLPADAPVALGNDTDVTCEGCNVELQRRAETKRRVLRTSAALAFELGHQGRAHHPLVVKLREAVNAEDLATIGSLATDLYQLSFDLFAPRPSRKADAFIAAVNDAGLRRTSRSMDEAVAEFGSLAPFVAPF